MANEKKITPAVYPASPKSIGEVNKAYIHNYLSGEKDKISSENKAKIKKAYSDAKAEHGTRYFLTYRKAFCKLFFPNLIKEPNTSSEYDFDKLFANW